MGFLKTFREHSQMAILARVVLSLTINSPFQTKLMGVDQISQF